MTDDVPTTARPDRVSRGAQAILNEIEQAAGRRRRALVEHPADRSDGHPGLTCTPAPALGPGRARAQEALALINALRHTACAAGAELVAVTGLLDELGVHLRSARGFRPPWSESDSRARLVAIEMAVSGNTREQVRHRLLKDQPLLNLPAILDDVFGPHSGPDSRVTGADGR